MVKHAAGLPPALAHRQLRLLRPRDARHVYTSNPSAELARLTERGLLHRVASGYYVIVPAERVADPSWRPSLAATAWAIAASDYGIGDVALSGTSAARHHGLIPRELAVAFVSVPRQRPALSLLGGEARFVRRDVAALDVERWDSELGSGWVTTLEQTALDLVGRPERWTLSARDLEEAMAAAAPRIDLELLSQLAAAQKKRPAAARLIERLAR